MTVLEVATIRLVTERTRVKGTKVSPSPGSAKGSIGAALAWLLPGGIGGRGSEPADSELAAWRRDRRDLRAGTSFCPASSASGVLVGVEGEAGEGVEEGDPVSMVMTASPTLTDPPWGIKISTTVPLTGEGISESTFSVASSKSGSPAEIVVPGSANQAAMVPSVTDSPTSGTRTDSNAISLVRLLLTFR